MLARLLPFLLLSVVLAPPLQAHPGGTDANGCHTCRTTCARWGEVSGARHCHGGGDGGGDWSERKVTCDAHMDTKAKAQVPKLLACRSQLRARDGSLPDGTQILFEVDINGRVELTTKTDGDSLFRRCVEKALNGAGIDHPSGGTCYGSVAVTEAVSGATQQQNAQKTVQAGAAYVYVDKVTAQRQLEIPTDDN